MKEIVVISGKGGTGKTSITASFAELAGEKIVAADCDVDAADMHLLLKPDFAEAEDFYSGELAAIDPERCSACGSCAEVCRFKAVEVSGPGRSEGPKAAYQISSLNCEGCGYCARVCPEEAITMEPMNVGKLYISSTKAGNTMVHARLGIGAENSGKLVARVKKEAKRIAEEEGKEFVLVDGSPGIGCPVVSSLSGADYVVLVTEPTASGLHDLKRVYQVVKQFHIPAGCIINKADLNPGVTREIERLCREEGVGKISSINYDETFTRAMTEGKTVIDYEENRLEPIITQSWEKILKILKTNRSST